MFVSWEFSKKYLQEKKHILQENIQKIKCLNSQVGGKIYTNMQ